MIDVKHNHLTRDIRPDDCPKCYIQQLKSDNETLRKHIGRIPVCECSSWARCGIWPSEELNYIHHSNCKQFKKVKL